LALATNARPPVSAAGSRQFVRWFAIVSEQGTAGRSGESRCDPDTMAVGRVFQGPVVLAAHRCQLRPPLLRRYGIEFPRPFLIKERAFGLVAAAPMFVTTRDEEEFAWPDSLFACLILI
jgi:hypothetical protein